MVASGTTKLLLFSAVLFLAWPVFGYAFIDLSPESPDLPTGINKQDLLSAGFMWGDNLATHNITNNACCDWEEFELDQYTYRVRWDSGDDNFYCQVEEWWGWWWRYLPPMDYGGLDESYIIDNWDDTYNWTWVPFGNQGVEADAIFTIPVDTDGIPVYDNITQCIGAYDNITVTIGRGIAELTAESDIWGTIWLFGNWYIQGLTSPFGGDYPAIVGIINYIVILIGLVAVAVYFRGI